MAALISEQQDKLFIITLNRVEKRNAFDDSLLENLQILLEEAIANPKITVILLKANGKDFCAGADISWMQRMAKFSYDENFEDALILARLMKTLYDCPKPTVVAAQGSTFGGGIGLVAACDIAIAAESSIFCFSEVKLGLIPAIISPYVVKAIGERAAKWLFLSAEIFDAKQAKELNLVQHCIEDKDLETWALAYAHKLSELAPEALSACKSLIKEVQNQPIDQAMLEKTADLLAQKRVSKEGQHGLLSFISKKKPQWNLKD